MAKNVVGPAAAHGKDSIHLMLRCPTSCAEGGCGQPSVQGSRWCERHQNNNSVLNARRDLNHNRWQHDKIYRMYNREPWPTFRRWMLIQNPICQRIDRFGEQCKNPANIVHHLISPRQRIDLFVDPKNVACLCERCHPPDEGTPHWRPGVDYVATAFSPPHIG